MNLSLWSMHFELWVTEWLIAWSPALSVKHEEESCVCTTGCTSAVSCRRQSPLTESDFEWTPDLNEFEWMNPDLNLNEWMNDPIFTSFGCAVCRLVVLPHPMIFPPETPDMSWYLSSVLNCNWICYHPLRCVLFCLLFILCNIVSLLHNTTASAPSCPFGIRSVFYYVVYFHFHSLFALNPFYSIKRPHSEHGMGFEAKMFGMIGWIGLVELYVLCLMRWEQRKLSLYDPNCAHCVSFIPQKGGWLTMDGVENRYDCWLHFARCCRWYWISCYFLHFFCFLHSPSVRIKCIVYPSNHLNLTNW